ncbi:MAG: metallophosphoesterase [Actinomycetota bacterium]|nr:metallophosphoesterase [Actinomycetota bacterium]
MIRVAAVADIHVGTDSRGALGCHWEHLPERADVFVLAGDLTKRGLPEEVDVLVEELDGIPQQVPTFAVLGNHDFESDEQDEVVARLEGAGVRVLEGTAEVIDVDGLAVGIAGAKGFGGGFPGACGTEFGEPAMKAFMRHSAETASRLEKALRSVEHADVRIAVMHYAPVDATLQGERLEIYPFLGSYFLAEAIDNAGADLALHGHAHGGSERGVTPGGVTVRNVAQPVLRQAYAVYCLDRAGEVGCGASPRMEVAAS